MKEKKTSPLRQRMIEDMRIRGMAEKTQAAHIRAVRDFAIYLKRSPDTATPEELRAYQLHMTNAGMTATTFNVRIVSLRFFFGMTCGRDEMKRHMQFRRAPRRLPAVLSVEEVGDILAAAPGPGLKYRAALGISYGAGLRAAELCHLRVQDIDSNRMMIHVEEGQGGPRGFVLPRFVNVDRHPSAAGVTPRSTSKNLQESSLTVARHRDPSTTSKPDVRTQRVRVLGMPLGPRCASFLHVLAPRPKAVTSGAVKP